MFLFSVNPGNLIQRKEFRGKVELDMHAPPTMHSSTGHGKPSQAPGLHGCGRERCEVELGPRLRPISRVLSTNLFACQAPHVQNQRDDPTG